MKKKIILITLISIFLSCNNKKEKIIDKAFVSKIHNGVFVSGTVNLPDNSVILLQEKLTNKTYKTIASSLVENTKFSFNEKISNPKLYFIGFNNLTKKIPFIANKYDAFITINYDDINNSSVKGAKVQDDYNDYLSELAKAKNKFVFKSTFIKEHTNSFLSAIVLKEMLGKTKWRIGQNKKSYHLLASKIKNSTIGKEINAFILKNEIIVKDTKSIAEVSLDPTISNETPVKIIEKAATISINPTRKKAPNFYAESLQGNDISLKDISKSSNVILVDFWASWCSPCRAQHPHLKKLYKKYHSKGFDIIGVSEDKYIDISKWKNAINLDGLPWHQVIDDNKRVAKMFGVSSIPHTFLLDKNGGIILNKNSTYTIEQKLKEIFGF